MNALYEAMNAQGLGLTEVLLALGFMSGTFILLFHVVSSAGRAKRQRQHMFDRLSTQPGMNLPALARVNVRRDVSMSSSAFLDQLIRRALPNAAKLRTKLERTGYGISVAQYLVASAVVGLLFSGLALVLLGLPIAACLLVGVALAAALPYGTIAFLGGRRLKRFVALFPESIDLIVRGIKSGLPVTESIKIVGSEMLDPIGVEFRQISDSIKMGMTLNEALVAALPRIDTPEYRFFLVSLGIQQDTGGNLAETLENLSTVIRKRRQMRLKIKAYASEAKASAYIVGSLPFIMFGIILVLNYGYASQLFIDPRGVVLIAAGLLSYAMGISIMWKMAKFEI